MKSESRRQVVMHVQKCRSTVCHKSFGAKKNVLNFPTTNFGDENFNFIMKLKLSRNLC